MSNSSSFVMVASSETVRRPLQHHPKHQPLPIEGPFDLLLRKLSEVEKNRSENRLAET